MIFIAFQILNNSGLATFQYNLSFLCTEPSFWLGNHAFAHEKQLCNNSLLHKKATQLADSGLTLIFVGNSKDIIGIIAIQDKIKQI
ncbi:hypothetical protein Q1H02_07265 [Francisella tularensis subsp. mediasiatica]|nr:hypothetical protein Q1H02_07265 [Francisella tularensis subsp. mediasiatica]